MVEPYLDFAFIGSKLFAAEVELPLEPYTRFWANNQGLIRQYRRENGGFDHVWDWLVKDEVISEESLPELKAEFDETKRNHVNIVPGLRLARIWPKSEALDLDEEPGRFASIISSGLAKVLPLWGQSLKLASE